MKIKELVKMDLQGEFISDVKLSNYENRELNKELLRKYIFTVDAPRARGAARPTYAAVEVLDFLIKSLSNEHAENRYVLTANYGRGKSHLALVLANFFSRPAESEEVKIVLGRLEQALNNPAQFHNYQVFKHDRREFLVVRLQGDRFEDLQDGFLRALEKALGEHERTRDIRLDLWTTKAEAWLQGLNASDRQKLEAFLEQYNLDIPLLISQLQQPNAYNIIREAVKHLTGFYPDFGREINLQELISRVINEICIPNQLGGLVVLFDEFSLFLQKYIRSKTIGKLQELLNGISDNRGRSVFLAFTQQDVDTVAEEYAVEGARLEDIRHELQRLQNRGLLFSLMESVLASYLKQDDINWKKCNEDQSFRAFLVQAREVVYDHFSRRYSEFLQWNPEALHERVVKGCFPLHPLTTAILSMHNFESGASENPRSSLAFVQYTWQKWSDQPVQLPNNLPNFVYPIALVDFYQAEISKRWYEAYVQAKNSSTEALTDEEQKILQALFLQQALDIKAIAGTQITLLQHLSGLRHEEVKNTLKQLGSRKIIRYDEINKYSSLWPVASRSDELKDNILINRVPIDYDLMQRISDKFPSLSLGGVAQEFGAKEDWTPKLIVATADMFTEQFLRENVVRYQYTVDGIESGPRGVIIWLIAQNEEEKDMLRQRAQSLVDKVVGSSPNPLPVLVILPDQPMPDLISYARLVKALTALGSKEREQMGTYYFEQRLAMANSDLRKSLDKFTGGLDNYASIKRRLSDYVLPAQFRASVQASGIPSIVNVISECYRQAYAYRVNFYTQYSVRSGGNLPKAVLNTVRNLLTNEISIAMRAIGNKDVQYQLVNHYLVNQWHILSSDYHIQPPGLQKLKEAWDLFEKALPPGRKDVHIRDILVDLLNPPFGHDVNTLALLLSAWIGYHYQELHLALGGKRISIEQFKAHLDEMKKPQAFLDWCVTGPLTISRDNPDEFRTEVQQILDKIREGGPLDAVQAKNYLDTLAQAMASPILPSGFEKQISDPLKRLQEEYELAQNYDQNVQNLLAEIQTADLDGLLQIQGKLNELRMPSLIVPTQRPLQELKNIWEEKLGRAVDTYCDRYSQLEDLSDFKANEEQLEKAKRKLKNHPVLVAKVDDALHKLKAGRDQLNKLESEKIIRSEIESMTPTADLRTLYRYKDRLLEMDDLSPQTEEFRQRKIKEIQNRIRQHEQLVDMLPVAVDEALNLANLRKQLELVWRNLALTTDTPIHQKLVTIEERIKRLEIFFAQLDRTVSMSQDTPADLDSVEGKIAELEKANIADLSEQQRKYLESIKDKLRKEREHRTIKAQQWLIELGQKFKANLKPDELLSQAQNPPAFLPEEDRAKLDQLIKLLQKKINEDHLLQIEMLFKTLDPASQQQCLMRLKDLVAQR